MATRASRDSRHSPEAGLLERILTTPQLARVVPQLQPEVLHRVIQHCGLEDCGELVTLATPEQLERVFDLDLWWPAAPGRDEQFDAARFGQWLDVLLDAGVSRAAETLAAMDVELIAVALARHVRVFDSAAVSPYVTLDGEVTAGAAFADGLRCEVGGFVVVARREDHWDAIALVLNALADEHGVVFDRIMRASCRQSHSRPEIDGLDDLLTADEQALFDVSLDREARSDAEGYVTPAQARAFLQTARRVDVRQRHAPARDPMTQAYFAGMSSRSEDAREESPEALATLLELLRESGVMPHASQLLLEGPQSRFGRVRACLTYVHGHRPDASAMRDAELVYLANVIVAGATIQSRGITRDEAADAVLAVCNLGIENWPGHWHSGAEPADDFLAAHDLVSVFTVGWTILHEDVCMQAAETLLGVIRTLDSMDEDVQRGLQALRVSLTRQWRAGTPWEARAALDVIAILDTPAWASLLGLIDQLPTLHGALRALLTGATGRIDASAFEFIAENSQIQRAREFMKRLPALLTG